MSNWSEVMNKNRNKCNDKIHCFTDIFDHCTVSVGMDDYEFF